MSAVQDGITGTGGRPAWAYFNNDIFGHAIDDALTLKSMVGQHSPMDFTA